MQPQWFRQYIEHRPAHRYVRSGAAGIHYQHWQNPGKPGLLFVHGHAAHAHWWDFIAPAFAENHDIAALDMSGSGDSEHRDDYSATLFAEEIIAVAEDSGLASPTVVGHSFGGAMTRVAAYLHPGALGGIILVDSSIPNRRGSRQPPPMPRQRERIYPTLEEGMRRFRLRPPQPCGHQYILDHIAAHSLRSTDNGYQFKLDSAVFAKMKQTKDFPAAADMVKEITIPVGFVYGRNSRFFPEAAVRSLRQIIPPSAIRRVTDAHHHVFLDQPIKFIKSLRELLLELR